MQRSRRQTAWLAGGLLAVAVAIPQTARSSAEGSLAAVAMETNALLLPDLVSAAPEPGKQRFSIGDESFPGLEGRLLLRFDGYITNAGEGPLHVTGSPQHADPGDLNSHDMWQMALHDDGSFVPVQKVPIQFETDDHHDHFHFMEIARYRLLTGGGEDSSVVAPSMKVGFCLVDSEPIPQHQGPVGERTYVSRCESGNPAATELTMGITNGWRDLYNWNTNFQWIDLSNVVPGVYTLEHQVDPHDYVVEMDENNPPALSVEPTVVPGFAPVRSRSATTADAATWVTLRSDRFESTIPGAPLTGDPIYSVVRAPRNGSLNVAVGESFRSSTIRYTPDDGFTGRDRFVFEVRNSASDYPLVAPRGVAVIRVRPSDSPTPPNEHPPLCQGVEATIWLSRPVDGAVIDGTDEADVIVGTPGPDTIRSAGGDDLVCSSGGDDVVSAGDGADRVAAGSGADLVIGGRGADVLDGGSGHDDIRGRAGGDVLRGGGGRDVLHGQGGDDDLDGGAGADFLVGGPGQDTVDGGPGIDTCTGFQMMNCEM